MKRCILLLFLIAGFVYGQASNQTVYKRDSLNVFATPTQAKGLIADSLAKTLLKALNGSDISNKETFRSNLNVYGKDSSYSKNETDNLLVGKLNKADSNKVSGGYVTPTSLNNKGIISVLDYGARGDSITDDKSSIQAALNMAHTLNGAIVTVPRGHYTISNELIIYSNTTLQLDPNAVIEFANTPATGYSGNMLTNASSISTPTVLTDVAMNRLGDTLTSASANFTNADSGKSIYVYHALPNSMLTTEVLCTTIKKVINSTTIITSDISWATISSDTALIYSRDNNIKIEGGTWNRNQVAFGNRAKIGGNTLQFSRVDGLILRDVNVIVPSLVAYRTVELTDVTEGRVYNVCAYGGRAGVQIQGPVSNTVLRDISGWALDDFVPLNATDYPTYGYTQGDIRDVVIDNVRAKTTQAVVKIFGGTGTKIRNVKITNIFADSAKTAINCSDDLSTFSGGYTDCGNIIIDGVYGKVYGNNVITASPSYGKDINIRNVIVQPSSSHSIVSFGTGNWSNVNVDNISAPKNSTVYDYFPVYQYVGSTIGNLFVSNIHADSLSKNTIYVGGSVNNLSVRNIQVNFTKTSTASIVLYCSGTIKKLTMDGISAEFSGSTPGEMLDVVNNIDNAQISNINLSTNTTNNSNYIQIYGTLNTYQISNAYLYKGRSFIQQAAGSTVFDGKMDNIFFNKVGRVGILASNAVINLSNATLDSTVSAAFYVNNASLTLTGGNIRRMGAQSGIQRAVGTETIHLVNQEFPADISLLLQSPGDKCWNTNTSLAGGAGPVMSNGTIWYSLGSSAVPSGEPISVDYNGSSSYTTFAFTQPIKSVAFYIYPRVTNLPILNFGTNMQITYNSSNVITYGSSFANTSTYINGVAGTTLTLNAWNYVVCNFDAITPTILEIGRYSTSYFSGRIAFVTPANVQYAASDILSMNNNNRPDLCEVVYKYKWASTTELEYSNPKNLNLWSIGDAVTVIDNQNDPDGGTDAQLITWNAGGSYSFVRHLGVPNFTSGKIYRFTISAKANSYDYIGLRISGLSGSITSSVFQFSTKTWTVSSANVINKSYVDLGGGWYRLSVDCLIDEMTNHGVCLANTGNELVGGRSTGNGVYVYNASLSELGAVSDYKANNSNSATWFDNSTNGINGTHLGSFMPTASNYLARQSGTSSFTTTASRKAIYLPGITTDDKYIVSPVGDGTTAPLASDFMNVYAKTDSLIIMRINGSTGKSGLSFTYFRIK